MKIAYRLPDERVCVVTPCIADLDRVRERCVPVDAVDVVDIADESVPLDRTFREAWRLSGGSIAIDMGTAREIQMDRIRVRRNAALAALDIEVAKADDAGGDAAALRRRRQVLRDIPQTFDLGRFSDPEALAAAWPDELK